MRRARRPRVDTAARAVYWVGELAPWLNRSPRTQTERLQQQIAAAQLLAASERTRWRRHAG